MVAHRYGTDHIPCSRGACAMATVQSTLSPSAVQDNVDLLRRYCPALAVHTHEQLAAYLVPSEQGCWPWPGVIDVQGYGKVATEQTPYGYKQFVPAHRYMYDLLVGEASPQHHVHHRCEVKACWNPFHLEALTPKEHVARHRHTPRVPAPLPEETPPLDSRHRQLVLLL